MKRYEIYSNVNGKETRKSGTLPDDAPLPECFPTFDSILETVFGGGLLRDALPDYVAPRSNKKHCEVTFPPSNAGVNPKTKELLITVAANDVNEDEYKVELDNDTIVVTFDRHRDEMDEMIYDWKGLKFVKDEVLRFKFNPCYYDATTTQVALKGGTIFVKMQPREEVKPVKRLLAGSLKEKKEEEKKEEE